MYLKPSVSKYICTSVGVLFTAFTITVIVYSISLKFYFPNKLRNHDYYDDDDDDDKNLYDAVSKERAAIDYNIRNIIFIKNRIEQLNKEQRIYNLDVFGPVRPTTVIMVIQVHENTAFLKVFLASLKKVLGISNSLLIFYHDYYDNGINNIIREIQFAKYMQVFYPYSNQMYPKMFPGSDKKFCTGDFYCKDLCTDSHECPRNSELVQQKHFWWWHVNHVFNHVPVIEHNNEPIVFLEEDQYVLEDILYMLKVLKTLMPENCPQCELIHFGAYAPVLTQFHVSNGKVRIQDWHPSLLNIGIAFNRTIWKTITNNSYHFCHYDDYRWDASLYNLASKRPQGPLAMLASDAPRVLRIELCDGSSAGCTLVRSIENVQKFAKSVHRGLYPWNFIIKSNNQKLEEIHPAGGWKDVRDSALCMYFIEE